LFSILSTYHIFVAWNDIGQCHRLSAIRMGIYCHEAPCNEQKLVVHKPGNPYFLPALPARCASQPQFMSSRQRIAGLILRARSA